MNLLNFPYNLQDMMKEEESHPTNSHPQDKTDDKKLQSETDEEKSNTTPPHTKQINSRGLGNDEN